MDDVNSELIPMTGSETTEYEKKDERSTETEINGTRSYAGEITCSQLGMEPNDVAAGPDNFTKLYNATQTGYKILVDNVYYLSSKSTRPIIDNDINWEGINREATFILRGATYFFDIGTQCGNIHIEGISFENNETDRSYVVFITSTKEQFVSSILIKNNVMNGSISFMRVYMPITLNPDETKYGVGCFEFSGNQVNNTNLSFLVFSDCPCERWLIANNKISNFDYTFLNLGISNDHSYPEQIFNACKLLDVHNNYVKCEDDWWGGESSGSYYVFVLFEGQKTIYHHNHIEGIHCLSDKAVYDAYLSANEVNYDSNVWINNICFNDSKSNNTLMKAKGGGGIKRYTNNHFIIEKEYAERLDQNPENLRVNLFESTSMSKRWEIRDNTIDVYSLIGQASSQLIEETWIINNDISCEKFSNFLICYRLVEGYDYSNIIYKICGNNIRIKSGKFGFIKNGYTASGVETFPSVEVRDNYLESLEIDYVTYEIKASALDIHGNTIIANTTVPVNPSAMTMGNAPSMYYGSYTCTGNSIQVPNSRFHTFRNRWYGNITEDFYIKSFGGVDANDNMSIPKSKVNDYKYRYFKRFEVVSRAGKNDFTLTFDVYYNPVNDYTYISFIRSSNNELVNYRVSKTTDTGNGDGHRAGIKLIGEYGPYSIGFINIPSLTYMYFDKWPTTQTSVHITTQTAEIGKFSITSSNDILNLASDLGGSVAIDIPDGIYSGYGLADALAAAMNSNTVLTGKGKIKFTVAWSIRDQLFTINASAGHTIAYQNSGSDAGLTFGFNASITAARSITSQIACG